MYGGLINSKCKFIKVYTIKRKLLMVFFIENNHCKLKKHLSSSYKLRFKMGKV